MLRRSFWRNLGIAAMMATVFVIGTPPRQAQANGICDCSCTGPGATDAALTATCASRVDCGISVCQQACAAQGAGVTAVPPSGGLNNYTCIGVEEPVPATAPARPETGGGTGTTQPTGGDTGAQAGGATPSGTGAPSSAGGTAAPSSAGGTGGASNSPNAPSAPAQGTLRLVLPPCTENGNCSLTDIINTGIRVANLLLALAGFAFLATVLWAGAQLLIFANDAKSVSKAQGLVQGAVTGLVIIMVAGVIVRLVSDTIGVNPTFLQAPGNASRNTTRPSIFNTNLGPRGSTPSTNP